MSLVHSQKAIVSVFLYEIDELLSLLIIAINVYHP